MLRLHDPLILIVDYGLGTLPTTISLEVSSAVSSDRRELEYRATAWKKTESTEVNDVLQEALTDVRAELEYRAWKPVRVYPPREESSEVDKAYYEYLAEKENEDYEEYLKDNYSEGEIS